MNNNTLSINTQSVNNIKKQILEYKKKLIELENQLYEYEKNQAIFNVDILENLTLNDNQKEIVHSDINNILVIACPGSGKTHTLISRYIYQISKNIIKNDETIIITFTKKSGMELTERLTNLVPKHLPEYVGSIHGYCYRILQKYNNINYTVLDETDTKEFIKNIIDKHIPDTEIKPELDMKALIKSKIFLIIENTFNDYPIDIKKAIKKFKLTEYYNIINNILNIYKKNKTEMKLLDFNDLLVLFCKFINTKKAENYLSTVKNIFFDEYQDVNPIQNYILKILSKNAKVMVVGDDSQAIYKFRGSDIKFIYDFEKEFENTKQFKLEINYRSTPSIVNFCQNIIENNSKQFKKDVKSNQNEEGIKPRVIGFESKKEQFDFIISDIKDKLNSGESLKDMVVLARKNYSLDEIELELFSNNIKVIKSLGISLLNKSHIKDLLAFLTVLVNDKSYLHWKRIIALHPNVGMLTANNIIDLNSQNMLENISNYINENNKTNINTSLIKLVEFYKKLLMLSEKEKIKEIVIYLENLMIMNKTKKIEEKMYEINTLLNFFYLNKNININDFINDLYLNKEMDYVEEKDTLFLSTVHGSKGLEWKYVYLIDFNSKEFPSIKSKFYQDEFEEMEEERRLFYVASSRAKQYLNITYVYDYHPYNFTTVSPLIKELNVNNYISMNTDLSLIKRTGIISQDVKTYLNIVGYKKLYDLYKNIDYNYQNLNVYLDIPKYLKNSNNSIIIGNFMDYLISKMIYNNLPDIVNKFDLNINNRHSFPKDLYYKYIDHLEDWKDNLDLFLKIASFEYKNKDKLNDNLNLFLLSENSVDYYKKLEIKIINYIKSLKPKIINCHYNLTYGNIKAEADLLIQSNNKSYLIEFKTSNNEICNLQNITQCQLYSYLCHKKGINIDSIILINLMDGNIHKLDISKDNSNICKNVKKLIYN
jgi:DNA helicase II / ATP-dependent DNA helicase PcrA